MTFEGIKRRFDNLTTEELRQELQDRSYHRYNVSKVGSADCMIDCYVIRACKELLRERGEKED